MSNTFPIRPSGSRFPYRWRIVALLFFLSAVNYLDRQTLSVLSKTLRETLGFTAVEYSYVVTGFLVAYGLGYLFSGRIVDRIGVRLAVFVAVTSWSLAAMGHAFATGWVALLGWRFALGIFESFNAPCWMKAVSAWAPKRERGLSTALCSNGNSARFSRRRSCRSSPCTWGGSGRLSSPAEPASCI